jgi:hypothetical protein
MLIKSVILLVWTILFPSLLIPQTEKPDWRTIRLSEPRRASEAPVEQALERRCSVRDYAGREVEVRERVFFLYSMSSPLSNG